MCNTNPQFRYSATLALNHPWITGNIEGDIPLTIYEEVARKRISDELVDCFRSIFFIAIKREQVLCFLLLESNQVNSQD